MKNLLLFCSCILLLQCTPDSEEIPLKETTTSDTNTTATASGTDYSNSNTADLTPTTFEPLNECNNGFAGEFPCAGYDLYAKLSLEDIETDFLNDIWGWTDPITNKEYVIQGMKEGTVFIDISDPTAPKILGKLPTHSGTIIWRDIKVYKDHAFIVSEAFYHGLQVFDLTRLREVSPPQVFTADAHLDLVGSAHNIVINEDTGYAYAVGAKATINGQRYNGGTIFIDIRNPKNPQYVGGYGLSRYVHDAQVVTYSGPDSDYAGKELFFGSSTDAETYRELIIVDVTDKAQPKLISAVSYPFASFPHQNWLTENHEYVLLGDETDESRYGYNTRTLVFDIKDLDAPTLHFSYLGTNRAIDHNGYVKGDSFFLASYSAGLREIDISNIADKQMQEIAFFDTSPEVDSTDFYGVWSIYPYFESGFIAISDADNGFFLVRRSQ